MSLKEIDRRVLITLELEKAAISRLAFLQKMKDVCIQTYRNFVKMVTTIAI